MRKICGAVAFLLVSVILVTWIMFGPLVKGAMSVTKAIDRHFAHRLSYVITNDER